MERKKLLMLFSAFLAALILMISGCIGPDRTQTEQLAEETLAENTAE